MNIGELLEFVNLLKKKLNYAGSNIFKSYWQWSFDRL